MALAGDMFQQRIDELFQGLPIMFGIADDIIIVGFNDMGRDHDATLSKVLKICKQANPNLNKNKFMDSMWITLKVITACS